MPLHSIPFHSIPSHHTYIYTKDYQSSFSAKPTKQKHQDVSIRIRTRRGGYSSKWYYRSLSASSLPPMNFAKAKLTPGSTLAFVTKQWTVNRNKSMYCLMLGRKNKTISKCSVFEKIMPKARSGALNYRQLLLHLSVRQLYFPSATNRKTSSTTVVRTLQNSGLGLTA